MKNSRNIAQRIASGAGLIALLSLAPSLVAVPVEGYDPLRQITQQVLKANLLLVLDTTGSQAWTTYGPNTLTQGQDSTGHLFWNAGTGYSGLKNATWGGVKVPNTVKGNNTGGNCTTTNCRYFYYTLVFEPPSRMTTWKNVLGNSVSIIQDYAAPAAPTYKSGWTGSGKTVTVQKVVDTTVAPYPFWIYTIDYGNNLTGADPGVPFDPHDKTLSSGNGGTPLLASGACTVGTCVQSPPLDVVGTNTDTINWGLMEYSTDVANVCAGSASFKKVAFDPDGNNLNIATIEGYLRLATNSGLNATGSTNTIAALDYAKTFITDAVAADKRSICNRPYGVILVTDGLSNQCNPNNGNWINPCGSGFLSCDGGTSNYDCPNGWSKFAAAKADAVYTMFAGNATYNKITPRTWVIGVSSQVGPCELDYIAYMGRTDASSPNNDAGYSGYDAVKNPYLPNMPTKTEGGTGNPTTSNSNFDGPTGQYKYFRDTTKKYTPGTTGHGHNAFFAKNADDLAEALATIIAASASGDYTTSAPVSGLSVGIGSNVYLASTEFPEWAGRLQAFDASKKDPLNANDYLRLWEASAVLSARTTARNVYTWDPSNANALVKITTSDSSLPGKLTTLAGTSVSSAVIDFILGGDGTGIKRTNILGPLINSTPAIVGAPSPYFQTNVVNHLPFETSYAARVPVLWVGSDDGMLHAFRVRSILDSSGGVISPGGEEIIALVPPSLLATQVTLYDTFVANKKSGTGQPVSFSTHYYGVANSLRFGDVYSSGWSDYKTVGFITMGPGVKQGSGAALAAGQYQLIAFDITHPTPGDPNYDASAPVKVLWSKKVGDITGLSVPWSVPALAPVDASVQPAAPGSSTFRLIIGSGYDNRNTGGATGSQVTGTNFQAPKLFVLDPVDGSLKNTIDSSAISAIKSPTSPAPWVGNQAFADSVFLDKKAKGYQNDNLADLGLQADLWGRVWYIGTSTGITFDSAKVGIDAYTKANQPQPVYYPPAASGVGEPSSGTSTSPGCTLFAFGSGTLYEKSANVTGPGVGTGSNFIPSLYVAAAKKPYPWNDGSGSSKLLSNTSAVDTTNGIFRYPIASLPRPTTDPYYSTTNKTLSPSSQMTGPPFLLVSKSGNTASTALFLVYDPAVGCNGYSYVIQVDVKPSSTCGIDQTPYSSTNTASNTVIAVYGAGEGAASGFTVAGTEVVVARSGIGADAKSTLVKPPVPGSLTGGPGAVRPAWWRELK